MAETRLGVDDLVAPLFVREGIETPVPIASMPGQVQHSLDSLVARGQAAGLARRARPDPLRRARAQGRRRAAAPGTATASCRWPCAPLRDAVGDELVLMADLCLDEYTDHGHCGVLGPTGEVLNDATLELYQRVALAQAEAGRRRGGAERHDGRPGGAPSAPPSTGAGTTRWRILAYAAKYASALYGPFRDAVDVTIAGGGDRRAYQQDPRNPREALAEIAQDVAEGADMVMVKPAMTSLDVMAAGPAQVYGAAGGLSRQRRVRHGAGGRRRRAGSTGRPWRSSS